MSNKIINSTVGRVSYYVGIVGLFLVGRKEAYSNNVLNYQSYNRFLNYLEDIMNDIIISLEATCDLEKNQIEKYNLSYSYINMDSNQY